MKMINETIKQLIIENLTFDEKYKERDLFVVDFLLSGGKFRDCMYNGKTLNTNTVSPIRSKYLPFVQFERNGVSIIESIAPEWLLNSNAFKSTPTTDIQAKVVEKTAELVVQPTIDFDSRFISIELSEAQRESAIQAQKELHEAEMQQIASSFQQQSEVAVKNLTAKHIEAINALQVTFNSEKQDLYESLRIRFTRETSQIYDKQLLKKEEDIEKANTIIENIKKEAIILNTQIQGLTTQLSDSLIECSQRFDIIKQKEVIINENVLLINQLNERINKLTPKYTRGFKVQATLSVFWLLGCFALSVFSVENMLIFFNSVSFWGVAFILAIFIEGMLWATNIARFSGILDEFVSESTLNDISNIIFVFRAFSNALGGYYIAINATDLAKTSTFYGAIATKLTNINELYFGYETGSVGMIITTIIVAILVTTLEFKTLAIAIKHWYKLFIETNE